MKFYATALVVCFALAEVGLSARAQEWTNEEQEAGTKTYQYTRFVPAGKVRILESFYSMNQDCSLNDDADTTITKEAEHGTAAIEIVERFPQFKKDNPRFHCNEKKIKMPVLTYKAAVGYTGEDKFDVTFVSPGGFQSIYHFTIKVTDPGSKKGGRAELRP